MTAKRLRIVKQGIIEYLEYDTLSGKVRKEEVHTWDKLKDTPALMGRFQIVIKPFVNGNINGVELELHEVSDEDLQKVPFPRLKFLGGEGLTTTDITRINLSKEQDDTEVNKPVISVNPQKKEENFDLKRHSLSWYREQIEFFFKTNGTLKDGKFNVLSTNDIFEKFEKLMQRVGTISELKRRNTKRTLYWKELLSHALNRMSINGDLKRTQIPHEGRRGKIAMYEWAKK